MSSNIKKTLSAWALIESLNPLEIGDTSINLTKDKFKENKSQKQIQAFDRYYEIWSDPKYTITDNAKNHVRQYKFLRKAYPIYMLEKNIKAIFNDNSEIFNQSQKAYYSYHFQTDSEGFYIPGSLHLPMIMTALKELKKDKNINIEEVYKAHFAKFEQEFNELFAEQKVTEEKLKKGDEIYSKYFEVIPYKFDEHGPHEHYVEIQHLHKNYSEFNLNSFFISDIERAKKNTNETLQLYIQGADNNRRIDIDENRNHIEKILSPENLPDGRWPSLVEHKLSMMQQVAVNQIITSNEKITSVNGPPGTGKTTLLKDIFAHIVVERAKIMTNLESPYKAFESRKLNESDEYTVPFLLKDLTNFKMVVTSSNNGAVENISMDLPKVDEIIRDEKVTSAYPSYEEGYRTSMKDLEAFSRIGSKLIKNEAWGIFSGQFGKAKNIQEVMDIIFSPKKVDDDKLNVHLQNLKSGETEKPWKSAVKDFKKELQTVKELKKEIQHIKVKFEEISKKYTDIDKNKELVQVLTKEINEKTALINNIKSKQDNATQEIQFLNDKIELKKQIIIDIRNSEGLIDKILRIFKGETGEISSEREKIENLRNDIEERLDQSNNLHKQLKKLEDENNNLLLKLDQYRKTIKSYKFDMNLLNEFKENHPGLNFSDDAFWSEDNYDNRQESVLWITDKLQYHRGQLFIKAMVMHKSILINNADKVHRILFDFKRRYEYLDSEPEKVENAWNLLHLIFPVISTTFASFGKMYETMPKDFIDYLFVDEAGQALPQAAVGAMMRSKKAIVVGDPTQIEPVVTLNKNLIDLVRKKYGIPERLLSIESSVQSLSDIANIYGYYKGNKNKKEWIGIPLWVHRRCLNPMFTISNQIAYDNKMVLPSYVKKNEEKGKTGKGYWYHSQGIARDKQYVKEHSELLMKHLREHWRQAIKEGKSKPNVFIISPFTAVKNNIANKLLKSDIKGEFGIGSQDFKLWVNSSVGTVHTFQGKEADIVYFVIGTDREQNGAVTWSCSKPNLLNVAVTRAKKEFYIIGDRERIKKMNFYDVIDKEISLGAI